MTDGSRDSEFEMVDWMAELFGLSQIINSRSRLDCVMQTDGIDKIVR